MSRDDLFYLPNRPPRPARTPRAGELLFEFLRASDGAPMSCELRCNGDPFGWEAQFFDRGELLFSRGGFLTRALAMQWAELERQALERRRRGAQP
jgi:hypothetical protein